jgi:ABC-2 type transport system permease protein
MHNLTTAIIRTSAFLRKEIVEIIRQPRLLLTLVLGPFLILFIFGIGYRNQPRSLRTLFVIPENSQMRSRVQDYATTLGPQLIFSGITEDLTGALRKLKNDQVDLVAVTPKEPFQKIRNNEQAMFVLYHKEIDPIQVNYVQFFGQIYIDEVNRRVLTDITQEGQTEASSVEDDLKMAQKNAEAMRNALQSEDIIAAQNSQSQLSNNLDHMTLALGASLSLLNSVQDSLGEDNSDYTQSLENYLSNIRQTTNQLNEFSELSSASQADIQNVSKIEQNLETLQSQIDQFTSISPYVLVRPFGSETKSVAPTQPDPVEYFTPAVIALLLQHLAVTFAALSIVRENNLGATELFRVSPISAIETLVGKYLSYFIFSVILTAILTALIYYGLRIPVLGNWVNYALVIMALLFTSLGIGFLISLLSQTDSQAVQLTMIVLLASVLFSGFMLNLELIWEPVKILSWTLPTTYGVIMLRDIFLLGQAPSPTLLLGLTGIGLLLGVVSWGLLRRELAKE